MTDENAFGADESTGGDFTPLVQAPKVEVKTHEEEEVVVFKMRSKLFVFVKEDVYGGETRKNFWKERGTGDVKLLRHKELGKIRLLMRQEKTLKICANHLVSPHVELTQNVGSDRSWVFSASDFADEEVKTETFAIKFGNTENATKFKDSIELAKKINGGEVDPEEAKPISEDDGATAAADKKENKEAAANGQESEGDKLAGELEKVKVSEDEQVLCGGFKEAEAEADEVKEAAKFAASKINKGELVKVVEAASQVVAGMNYRMKLHIKHDEGELNAHLVQVFKPLPSAESTDMSLKLHTHIGKV